MNAGMKNPGSRYRQSLYARPDTFTRHCLGGGGNRPSEKDRRRRSGGSGLACSMRGGGRDQPSNLDGGTPSAPTIHAAVAAISRFTRCIVPRPTPTIFVTLRMPLPALRCRRMASSIFRPTGERPSLLTPCSRTRSSPATTCATRPRVPRSRQTADARYHAGPPQAHRSARCWQQCRSSV
jgi:hypothetical protein